MFSLHGILHKDGTKATWKNTLDFIKQEGKKPGQGMDFTLRYTPYRFISDWLNDKIEAKFPFPALLAAMHQDQLCNGSGLTLVGGVLQGERYDNMQLRLLQNLKETGVSSRYQPNTPSAQAFCSVNWSVNSKKRQFEAGNAKIQACNNKLRKLNTELQGAQEASMEAQQKVTQGLWPQERLNKARLKVTKLEGQYAKAEQDGQNLVEANAGSGKVKVHLT
ncbi:hypothetical protein BDP27DRAFT_1367436 [Rhodocollybia butyracea]|uniref:Uncharacterized protein n=1 Tax=Rhodocollybia butyracea TaxID=206335 RepID=A0A9P5PLG3_9AGAR|nr:hypothetical protein BDP27DRAFT_1367436 [Rhodocollybia butyracea]